MYIGQELSIEINNAMVLSNDLTLTEHQLKCLVFSIVNYVYSPLVEYATDCLIYNVDVMKGINGP